MEKRDPQIFEEIMETYGEEMKRLIYSYTHDWGVTEDLTQEVFISVFKHLNSFRGDSHIRTWVYSIAMNKCKDYHKSWYFRKVFRMNDRVTTRTSTQMTPEDITSKGETRKEILDLLQLLPSKYKEVILLFYYAELTEEEIHTILRVPQATVKTRLRRGQKRLAILMEGVDRDV